MGCYAEAVRAMFPGGESVPPLRADTGWVLVTHGDLSPRQARRLFPAPPRLLVLSFGAGRSAGHGVSYARVLPGPPPRVEPGALAALDGSHGVGVLLDGLEGTSGRLLLQLHRHGVKRVAWRTASGWVVADSRRAAWLKPLRRVQDHLLAARVAGWYHRRLSRDRAHEALLRRNAQSFPGEADWLAHVRRVGVRPGPPAGSGLAGTGLKVVLYIGQLNSGGAERQLCNLALGLRRRGDAVRVLTTYPLADENAHYLHLLRAGGVPTSVAGVLPRRAALDGLRALHLHPDLVGALPGNLRHPVLDLCGELLADPPHVLHCWLDQPNIIGAAAGALAGAPHVVLSTRNVNPTFFPAFYHPWMDGWYRFLAGLPQVHLLANSGPGADDYARWLGLPRERFHVIRNGVDLASMTEPSAGEAAALRASLGLAPGQPLLLGVFRLAPEKQPGLFLDVVERVRRQVPDLAVALAGVGPLREAVERGVRERGLQDCVRLLGQRRDVPALLAAADALLLTSAVEGTPNVILEAQWLGCPPVATAVGGTPDAVADGATGFLRPVDDAAGLAAGVTTLLADPVRRQEMARAGREFVRQRFGLPRMLDETLACYAALMSGRAAADTVAVAGAGTRVAGGAREEVAS